MPGSIVSLYLNCLATESA